MSIAPLRAPNRPAKTLVIRTKRELTDAQRRGYEGQIGKLKTVWTDGEWLTVTRALIRFFPAQGFADPANIYRLQLAHMVKAMSVLPTHRHRQFKQLVGVREQLVKYINAIKNPDAPIVKAMPGRKPQQKPEPTPAPKPAQVTAAPPAPAPVIAALPPTPAPAPALDTPPPRGTMISHPVSLAPPSMIYRQPDGEDAGPPKGKVYFTDSEWYKLAIEIAYKIPSSLETLISVRPIDVYHAQRVLPTNRRRPPNSLHNKNILPDLTPAFKKLRAAVSTTRKEIETAQARAQQAEIDQQAQRQAEAQRAAHEAAQAAMRADLMASPAFVSEALATVGIGALFEAFAARLAASAQGMIEAAVINALCSDRVKNAIAVKAYPDSYPASAPSYTAPPLPLPPSAARDFERLRPPVIGEAHPPKQRKIIIGILGMKSVQAQELQKEFPQFEILHQENVTTKAVQEMQSAAKVIGSRFMTHAPEPTIIKHFGDKYTRLHGGISMIKRQIRIWIAAGVFGADAQGAKA